MKTLVEAGQVISDKFVASGVRVSYYILLPLGICFNPDFAMLGHIAFLSCVKFAVLNRLNEGIMKKVICLESVYLHNDAMCVIPTGYGKSLIFHLFPMLFFA